MQYTTIPTDEYARLIRSEATMECLDVYLKSEYAEIKFIRSLVNYAMNYLPFTVHAEPNMPESFQSVGVNPAFDDKPGTEEGWHE